MTIQLSIDMMVFKRAWLLATVVSAFDWQVDNCEMQHFATSMKMTKTLNYVWTCFYVNNKPPIYS